MLQSKSSTARLISIVLTVVFLFVSIVVNTESVSAASKLKVTAAKKTIYVGQTVKLKANKNVKWSVSKKKIAKLTKVKKRTVTVKGLKAGTVYVKAKAGKKYKKIKITVKKKPNKKKMKLAASSSIIGIGEYCSVTVVSDSSGAINNAYFSSSDESVLTVNRRGLVIGISPGTATVTATSKTNKSQKASADITVVATRAGTITLDVDMSGEDYPAGATKVWLPVPKSDELQVISQIQYDAPGATAGVTEDSEGGNQLYIEWDENTSPEDRKASLSYHIYRKASVHSKSLESIKTTVDDVDKKAFAEYLKPFYYSGDLDSGIIRETADKIVADAGAKTVYEKAYAIYDWMCDNLTRYDDVSKPLKGEIPEILKEMKANTCIEVSAVFATLCRAEGIPARCLYGLRFINKNGIPSANCRAEFYLPDYGWVPADPALAIKQSWGHENEYLSPDAPKRALWEGIKENYWVNAEENWICLNKGHDIWLDPKQETKPDDYMEVINPDGSINYYILPYVEVNGQYVSIGKLKYGYSYEAEDPLDCGCL